jgi:hypothetical protein
MSTALDVMIDQARELKKQKSAKEAAKMNSPQIQTQTSGKPSALLQANRARIVRTTIPT